MTNGGLQGCPEFFSGVNKHDRKWHNFSSRLPSVSLLPHTYHIWRPPLTALVPFPTTFCQIRNEFDRELAERLFVGFELLLFPIDFIFEEVSRVRYILNALNLRNSNTTSCSMCL